MIVSESIANKLINLDALLNSSNWPLGLRSREQLIIEAGKFGHLSTAAGLFSA